MGLWTKMIMGGVVLALITAMVLLYNHTMKENGALKVKLDAAEQSVEALQGQIQNTELRFTALSLLIAEHAAAIQKTSSDLAKKQSYATRVYQESDNAARTILDADLPQFRCLYEKGGCEAPTVRN